MLKSFVDKIPTKLNPWVFGCKCCMFKRGKHKKFLRKQKRQKLKRILKNEEINE